MSWLFGITAAIVMAYIGRWAVRERDTIAVYHDCLVRACDEEERETQ